MGHIVTDSGNPAIQYNQEGETLLQSGDIEKAISALEQAISKDPDFADAYNNMACAYMLKNNYTTALEYITRAYELEQNNQAIVLNTGTILASLGALDDALLVFRSFLDHKPGDSLVTEKLQEIEQIRSDSLSAAQTIQTSEAGAAPTASTLYSERIQAYIQPPSGNTEKYINLQAVAIKGNTQSSYQALKDYEIIGTGSGLDAVKHILLHILQNKLGIQSLWNDAIWRQTIVVQVHCKISNAGTGDAFSVLRPTELDDIDPQFSIDEGPTRTANIASLSTQLGHGTDLGMPLYVTGTILNQLGGQISDTDLYMIDGAHRISAHALAHKDDIDILLLAHETEYKNLVNQDRINTISTMVQGISWFSSYQSIPLTGLSGERTLKRFDLMNLELLKDSTVMDFGCNIGQACIAAVQAGALNVMGIEGHVETYHAARAIGDITGFSNLDYINIDFNDPEFDKKIDAQHPDPTDYSFFFSVYRTKELTQREALFRYIINKSTKGIFFEGHAHPKIDTIEYHDWLFECFGLKYEFLGYSEQDIRPLFFINPQA